MGTLVVDLSRVTWGGETGILFVEGGGFGCLETITPVLSWEERGTDGGREMRWRFGFLMGLPGALGGFELAVGEGFVAEPEGVGLVFGFS